MSPKRHSYKGAFERLYAIAEDQQGYFTTKQAEGAGFDGKNHAYHVRAGNWEREHRGIYRLKKYPAAARPDLVLWSLWSRNRDDEPQGVYSHETALSIYDLSDLNPAKIHMTVPPGFRRNGALPGVLVLHKGVLEKDEVEAIQGFRVTKPLRAIADLMDVVEPVFIEQACRQAYQRGLIHEAVLEQSRLPDEVKRKIKGLWK